MNINRIMVTGGRSPVALNLVRILHKQGYKVYVAESEEYHLSKKSNAIEESFVVPKPNEDYREFIRKLLHHCLEHRIQLIIPTCEEIFHIAKAKEKFEENGVRIFSSDIDTLRLLHNKYTFNQFLAEHDYICPETHQFTSKEALLNHLDSLSENETVVLKAVYSRFASNVSFIRKGNPLHELTISDENPWILQQFIRGTQYCSYSIAIKGELVAHTCYPTIYTAGLGANVFFKHVVEPQIEQFVNSLVKELNFTGQIAFDFMMNKEGVAFPIECNQRATSGLHLFNDSSIFHQAFTEEEPYPYRLTPNTGHTYKLGIPMLMYGFSEGYLVKAPLSFLKDFQSAKDVIFNKEDIAPYFYQAVYSVVMLKRKLKTGKSLTELTTTDIEWSGK